MQTNQAIAEALQNTYEVKFIADDKNRPRFHLGKKKLKEILILLTKGFKIEEIASYFGFKESAMTERLALLEKEELVQKTKEGHIPNVMVVPLLEGEVLLEEAAPLAEEMVYMMEEKLPKIKEEAKKIPSLAAFSFEKVSFLLLSGMLLDFLQIGPLQEECLKEELPLRNGKRYSIALLEKDPSREEESFGIPGNRVERFGDYIFGIYGKFRMGKHFLNLEEADLKNIFSLDEVESVEEEKERLLERLLAHKEKDLLLEENIRKGFQTLDISDEKGLAIPVLAREDEKAFVELAGIVREDIKEILSSYEEEIKANYGFPLWRLHVTYGEFFLWFYHFFYTVVTEGLIARKTIKLPRSKNAQYIVR